jgi:hypothetical protein
VNQFFRGMGYARVKLFTGTLFIVLGVVTVVRTIAVVGLNFGAITPLVAGAAMIGLGAFRWRDYLRRGST